MTHFIESDQLSIMQNCEPHVDDKAKSKEVKYSLLDGIEKALGDKWDRLKEGTRQTFDMICFLSADRGFFYATDDYLAVRHDISDRTVRNRLKELIELGQVVKVNKRAKKTNGKGKAVYLFVNHPFFKRWAELLNLDVPADFPTEKAEILCESKDKAIKKEATYSLSLKHELHNYKEPQSNSNIELLRKYAEYKIKDLIEKEVTIKYISSYLGKMFKNLEMTALIQAAKEVMPKPIPQSRRFTYQDVAYDWQNQ